MFSFTIGKRIVFGFAGVLLLFAIVGSISFNALRKSSDGFSGFQDYSDKCINVDRIQINLLMTRINVKEFILNGNTATMEPISRYLGQTIAAAEELEKKLTSPERLREIREARETISGYAASFDKAKDLRIKADRLMQDVVLARGAETEKMIADATDRISKGTDIESLSKCADLVRRQLTARLYVMKYDASHDKAHSDRAMKELEAFNSTLADIRSRITDEETAKNPGEHQNRHGRIRPGRR